MNIPDLLYFSIISGNLRTEGQLVKHGDLLSELKRVQEGLLGGFERELTTPNTLLITGSGVRVPRHPLMKVNPSSTSKPWMSFKP